MAYKRALGMVLLLAFIIQMFGNALIVANHYIHRDFIEQVFCINKDKPKMHCKGACHLKKQLEQEAEKQAQSPVRSEKGKHEIQLYAVQELAMDFGPEPASRPCHPLPRPAISERHLHAIFHPPQV